MTDEATLTKAPEWHTRRSRGIGGSEVASILGLSPYRTAHVLWLEKSGRVQPEDISGLPHVLRGVLGEETCRMMIEQERLRAYRPKTWQGDKPHYLCSDDGFNPDEEEILEIKAMGKDNHEAASRGIVPPHYLCQCIWNLFVSKAKRCWFVSFRPEDGSKHEIEVLPDPVEAERIAAAVDHFWLVNVQGDVPPPLTINDAIEIALPEFEALLVAYLAERSEELRDRIKPYLVTHPNVRTPGGYRASITARGSISVRAPRARLQVGPASP
jgi:putative phage-type endonuclease